MERFKELTEKIYRELHMVKRQNKDVCEQYGEVVERHYKVAKRSKDYTAHCNFIKKWLPWLFAKKVVNKFHFSDFTRAELKIHFGLYIDQKDVNIEDERAVLVDCDGRVTGHCLVNAFGSGRLEVYDTSFATLYDQYSAVGRDCIIHAFGESDVIISGYGKLELWDQSSGDATGKCMVIIHDEAEFNETVSSGVFVVDARRKRSLPQKK